MMDSKIGRHVTSTDATKANLGEVQLPGAVVWGPNGVVQTVEQLSGKKFKIEENEKKKTFDISLNNSEYSKI